MELLFGATKLFIYFFFGTNLKWVFFCYSPFSTCLTLILSLIHLSQILKISLKERNQKF